jgi:hypothetical protein
MIEGRVQIVGGLKLLAVYESLLTQPSQVGLYS